MLKFNMGCGDRKLDGYVNVDCSNHCNPDELVDLEYQDWPWKDSCADEVQFLHSLEHMGGHPSCFIHVMKELYRICADDAKVRIVVPHHRSDDFFADPTHVRPITVGTLALFSKDNNEAWKKQGFANTPLALMHNVDFTVIEVKSVLNEPYSTLMTEGKINDEKLIEMERHLNNVVLQMEFILSVHKD